MGATVELSEKCPEPTETPRQASWSSPKAAFAQYRPGLSPYLHYWQALRARRNQTEPLPEHGAEEGNSLPDQMQTALEDLISRSFGT